MATMKQKKAFKEVLNGSTISGAMIKAGYSETTASTTGKLTNTKGWEELMDKHFPDKLLAKKHHEGLNATTKKPQLIDRDDKGRPIYEYIPEEDYATRFRYLDSAYKLKKKYPEESLGGNKTLIIMVSGETAERYGIQTTPNPGDSSERQA